MSDIEPEKPAHLTQLPEKSFSVKPGEVVGGLVYVMDKPLGIEEGMVGISVDSPAYKDFIKGQIAILRRGDSLGEFEYETLQKIYNSLFIKPNDPPTDEDIKFLIGFPTEKRTPETAAIGRIMFELYKKSLLEKEGLPKPKSQESKGITSRIRDRLGIPIKVKKTKKENMDEISRLMSAGNKVYMVKQDGGLILGRTGPSIDKIAKTTTGKAVKKWTLGIGLYFWKAYYLFKNDPVKVNADVITEVVSTKIAAAKGFPSQEIDTIEGTYGNGAPKVATIVTWTSGCRDLGGRLEGSDGIEGVLVKKINGVSVSDDSVYGLGESLVAQISLGDRDGIGSKGQNKAIVPLTKEEQADLGHKFTDQFYGIDFGKSYQSTQNPIVQSLQDDFSFTNPGNFKNYSMLYDNPLRDKMKGVYMLAALRGELSEDHKLKIVKEYETDDPLFAKKLRGYPGDNPGVNGDKKLLKAEIDKYTEKAKKCQLDKNHKKENEYNLYVSRLKDIDHNLEVTDNKILQVFEQRLKLTPSQIDLIDNLEKLTAKKATMRSDDGTVLLNHIRVQPKDRIKWQIVKEEDGNYKLFFETQDQVEITSVTLKINRFLQSREKLGIYNKLSYTPVGLEFNLDAKQLEAFSKDLTEGDVAEHRKDTNKDFNQMKALKAPTPQTSRPRSKTVELPKKDPPELATRPRSQSVPRPPSAPPSLSRSKTAEPLTRRPSVNTTTTKTQPISLEPKLTDLLSTYNPPTPSTKTTSPSAGNAALNASRSRRPPYAPLSSRATTSTQQAPKHLIITQENASLEKIIAYSEKEGFKDTHPNITKLTPSSQPEGDDKAIKEIQVTLKDSSKSHSKEIHVTVQENPDANQLKYIAPINQTKEEFEFTAKEACRLAVFSAKDNAVFDFSKEPDKTAFLVAIFLVARKEAMDRNPPKFTEETKPRLRSELPPAQTARAVLK
jgi:hypothetical protein